ncbi:hypothetical protein COLO4_30971 [Corchorus olitorius]|uniref:Lipase, GDSL n=1 Tax=Corchorus olitorius TaxID=93759 RepID=A0A1R3H679_9ROSI|nr:hypothetical protein COLO4_30971 [Corchorus olitorius]
MGTIFNRLKLIYTIYLIVGIYYSAGICSAQNVSAFFVFGDSLVDVGNSYYLYALAKAEYPDEEELGFKDYAPPFLDPNTTGDVILKGVNYATAASGILNSTGYLFGQHVGMGKQVDNFAKTRQEIISKIGEASAKQLLRQALYIVGIGSDDIAGRLISPSNGFENEDTACCGGPLGRHGGFPFGCGSFGPICEDRTKSVFWDQFHPTEAFNLIAAKRLLDGGLNYASPMNLRQLANSH